MTFRISTLSFVASAALASASLIAMNSIGSSIAFLTEKNAKIVNALQKCPELGTLPTIGLFHAIQYDHKTHFVFGTAKNTSDGIGSTFVAKFINGEFDESFGQQRLTPGIVLIGASQCDYICIAPGITVKSGMISLYLTRWMQEYRHQRHEKIQVSLDGSNIAQLFDVPEAELKESNNAFFKQLEQEYSAMSQLNTKK